MEFNWIKCSDALPETHERVLVWVRGINRPFVGELITCYGDDGNEFRGWDMGTRNTFCDEDRVIRWARIPAFDLDNDEKVTLQIYKDDMLIDEIVEDSEDCCKNAAQQIHGDDYWGEFKKKEGGGVVHIKTAVRI